MAESAVKKAKYDAVPEEIGSHEATPQHDGMKRPLAVSVKPAQDGETKINVDESKKRFGKKVKKPVHNRCQLFLTYKNRQCLMQSKKGHKYCSEHISHDEANTLQRTPCPLDPAHSVWAGDLEAHLLKCNARPTVERDLWYRPNFNTILQGTAEEPQEPPIQTEDPEENLEQVLKLLKVYGAQCLPLRVNVLHRDGLDRWLELKTNHKHILQQSSLVGAMDEAGLLTPDCFYVEFGCGKAELSRIVNTCMLHQYPTAESTTYGFGFVDRGVNRMKLDSKIVKDCAGTKLSPHVKRSRIDIEHLDLDVFLQSTPASKLVAISKHLCGAATDLTLKLILNAQQSRDKFAGVVVAMCCRHACDYHQLLPPSRQMLARHGFTGQNFTALKKVVSWAVSSTDESESQEDFKLKRQIGLVARRLIDESRVEAINKLWTGYKAELFVYAGPELTLENHCLRVTKVETQEQY